MPASRPPRPNVLGYALLGLLARGERSGYDLTQGLRDPVGYFWHAQHSQVYPELARLEGAGLIAHTVVAQTERPDKKVYTLTDAGHAALRTWLDAETEVPRKRDELVLKAYSIWQTEPARAAELLRAHARIHAAHQAEFERRLADVTTRAGAALHDARSPWFGVQAVLRRGIGYEREYREWCEWLAGTLEASEGGTPAAVAHLTPPTGQQE